jgi:hypothetical protein
MNTKKDCCEKCSCNIRGSECGVCHNPNCQCHSDSTKTEYFSVSLVTNEPQSILDSLPFGVNASEIAVHKLPIDPGSQGKE